MPGVFLILPAHNRSPKPSKRLRHALCRLQYGEKIYDEFVCEHIGPPVDHILPKRVTFGHVPRWHAHGYIRYS